MDTLAGISLNPVNRSRLHEEIVSQIEKKILGGTLSAGEKLPTERELAVTLGVNRATVREALKKLEMLGLVEINHGDGIYVKDFLESGNLEVLKALLYREGGMDAVMMQSILDIRKILAPEMAALAAANRGEKHLAELKAVLDRGEEMPVLEADLAVHHVIARAGGNFLNIFILNFFNQLFRDYGFLYFDDPRNAARSRKFHRDIYMSLRERDAEKSRKIMKDVLQYAGDRTMEKMGGK